MKMEPTVKQKILVAFLAYGVVVGLLSVWWWHQGADSPFLLNIPGVLLGDKVYELSIMYLGNPNSPQAHYTISWFLRIPQVYFPVSALLWGAIGLVIQLAWSLKQSQERNLELGSFGF